MSMMRRQTFSNAKSKLIAAGLYRPARFLADHVLYPARSRDRRKRQNFYRQLIAPGDLCFDVGANIGDYTETLVSLGARVVAVEPQPACIDELRARFAGNDRVTVVPAALGATEGAARLFLREWTGLASLHPDWEGRGHLSSVQVPISTIDRLIATYGRPKYIKIDVEGYELPVISGLHSKIELISFEYHLRSAAKGVPHDEAIRIIAYIKQFGELQIAILGDGAATWTIPWTKLDDLFKVFPDRMPSTADMGDIFCKYI
jgi:FkbM family methyltransferase